MSNKLEKDKFLKDVASHDLTIIKDDDLYRHIRLSRPGSSCMRFDIITWPGSLCYTGDMGSYVFSRRADMFSFFRDSRDELSINPYYWSEKLQASDCTGRHSESGAMEFSMDAFEKRIHEEVEDFINNGGIGFVDEDNDEEKETYQERLDSFKREIKDLVSLDVECHSEAHRRLREWEFATDNMDDKIITAEDVFGVDAWEWDFRDYTFRFIWCCYALVWGIQQYDKAMESDKAA